MEYLYSKGYDVTVYSSLYLKSAKKVLELLDDGRRTLPATKQHIQLVITRLTSSRDCFNNCPFIIKKLYIVIIFAKNL